jgi:hypothetical protein
MSKVYKFIIVEESLEIKVAFSNQNKLITFALVRFTVWSVAPPDAKLNRGIVNLALVNFDMKIRTSLDIVCVIP